MTQKRFNYIKYNDEYCDVYDKSNVLVSHIKYVFAIELVNLLNELAKENEQLKSFKNNVYDLIDELIKKVEKDVEDLKKDAYEKGYAYNPYYYWGVAHGLKKLKKELEND